jgi:hypothetical protein
VTALAEMELELVGGVVLGPRALADAPDLVVDLVTRPLIDIRAATECLKDVEIGLLVVGGLELHVNPR